MSFTKTRVAHSAYVLPKPCQVNLVVKLSRSSEPFIVTTTKESHAEDLQGDLA